MLGGYEVLNGIDVLSVTPIVKNTEMLTMALILLFTFLASVIIGIAFRRGLEGVVCGLILLIVELAVFISIHENSRYSDRNIYKVTIDDSVSMNEFTERYEILSQDGRIYEIIERDGK